MRKKSRNRKKIMKKKQHPNTQGVIGQNVGCTFCIEFGIFQAGLPNSLFY